MSDAQLTGLERCIFPIACFILGEKKSLKAHDQSISVKQVEPVHVQCTGLISVILNKGA